MGHNMGYVTGPLALAGGIGATALGQPEIGLPLIASGIGGTIGQGIGGGRGSAIGSGVGGALGLGADLIPGLGTSASGALSGLGGDLRGIGSKISGLFGSSGNSALPGGGQVPGMQLSPEMQQLAQRNPSLAGMNLSGATVAGAMPGAPTQQQVTGLLGDQSQRGSLAPLAQIAMGMMPGAIQTQDIPPTPAAPLPSGATRGALPPTQIVGGQPLPNPTTAGASYRPPMGANYGLPPGLPPQVAAMLGLA